MLSALFAYSTVFTQTFTYPPISKQPVTDTIFSKISDIALLFLP
jgi:hypothetical protein